MRYALVDNLRVEAGTGLKGICSGCSQPVIAKCGTQRIHHWAHQKTKMCDNWWQPETEWHRSWKNNFPASWQEVFLPDVLTGEKHIADVRTEHGLIIEFQHSHLKPEERLLRESFYQNMVWVVDGTCLKHGYSRFLKGYHKLQLGESLSIFRADAPEECFPEEWLNCRVPVVFDFKGLGGFDDRLGLREPLYCLFPIRIGKTAELVKIPRQAFIKHTTNGEWIDRIANRMEILANENRLSQRQEEIARLTWQLEDLKREGLAKKPGYGKGRIF